MRRLTAIPCLALICLLLHVPQEARSQQEAPSGQEPAATEGVKAYYEGDYKRAKDLLLNDISSGHDTLQHRLLLARTHLRLNERAEAEAAIQQILQQDKGFLPAIELKGRMLFEDGKWQEAEPLYREVLKSKKSAGLHCELGQILFNTGRYVDAKHYFKLARDADLVNPVNYVFLGRIYLERGFGYQAERNFARAMEYGASGEEIHWYLASAYGQQGKLLGPVLVRQLGKAGLQPGTTVDELLILGPAPSPENAYFTCTKASALYHALKALQTRPDSPEMLLLTASAWRLFGDFARAKELILKMPEKARSSPDAVRLHLQILLDEKSFDSFLSRLKEAEAEGSVKPLEAADFRYAAACRLRAAGDYARAESVALDAEKQNPTSATYLRILAELSQLQDKTKEAVSYYERLLELYPDAKDADTIALAVRRLKGEANPGE